MIKLSPNNQHFTEQMGGRNTMKFRINAERKMCSRNFEKKKKNFQQRALFQEKH